MGHVVRALFFLLIALGAPATTARAQSLQVSGHAGVLGEWELNATVAPTVSQSAKKFSGPLTMKHVGLCTQDGPEEKTGEIRIQISGSSSRMKAILLVDGVECAYSGRLTNSYTGMMNCPDRRAVPLTLWVK
jgi:hypothetical protein